MNQDCWDTKDSPLHIWFQGGLPFYYPKEININTKNMLEAQTKKESLGENYPKVAFVRFIHMQHPPKKRSPKNPSLSKKI